MTPHSLDLIFKKYAWILDTPAGDKNFKIEKRFIIVNTADAKSFNTQLKYESKKAFFSFFDKNEITRDQLFTTSDQLYL